MDDFYNWICGNAEVIPEVAAAVRLGILDCAFTFVGLLLYLFKK